MTRAITITSGKGGVGKTNISLNIALKLSSLGHKICLFDADLGLANINILLGIRPQHDINDLIGSKHSLHDILYPVENIDILPGSSGVEELANLAPEQLSTLLKSLASLSSYDYLIFDTSAGIAKNVISFCLSCPETVIVITPEPTSLTDAYALLKVLTANKYSGSIKVIINQCADISVAKKVYKRFKDAVDQFINIPIEALGVVYKDPRVVEAVGKQVPFIKLFPDTIASRCINKVTERLLANQPEKFDQEVLTFWEKCLHFMTNPLELTGAKSPSSTAVPSAGKAKTVKPEAPEVPSQKEAAQVHEKPEPEQEQDSEQTPLAKPTKQQNLPESNLENSITLLAQSITDGIQSLSSELKEIRKELLLDTRRNGNATAENDQEEEKPSITEVKPIALDINSFVKRQSQKET